jgi:hypothetical protein
MLVAVLGAIELLLGKSLTSLNRHSTLLDDDTELVIQTMHEEEVLERPTSPLLQGVHRSVFEDTHSPVSQQNIFVLVLKHPHFAHLRLFVSTSAVLQYLRCELLMSTVVVSEFPHYQRPSFFAT